MGCNKSKTHTNDSIYRDVFEELQSLSNPGTNYGNNQDSCYNNDYYSQNPSDQHIALPNVNHIYETNTSIQPPYLRKQRSFRLTLIPVPCDTPRNNNNLELSFGENHFLLPPNELTFARESSSEAYLHESNKRGALNNSRHNVLDYYNDNGVNSLSSTLTTAYNGNNHYQNGFNSNYNHKTTNNYPQNNYNNYAQPSLRYDQLPYNANDHYNNNYNGSNDYHMNGGVYNNQHINNQNGYNNYGQYDDQYMNSGNNRGYKNNDWNNSQSYNQVHEPYQNYMGQDYGNHNGNLNHNHSTYIY